MMLVIFQATALPWRFKHVLHLSHLSLSRKLQVYSPLKWIDLEVPTTITLQPKPGTAERHGLGSHGFSLGLGECS